MSTELQKTNGKQKETLKSLLCSEAVKRQIAAALPKHITADRMIRCGLTAMLRTPKLAQCDQNSFFQAMLSLSQFGLEPDGRRAHLIPFENRKKGIVECQLIIDYKGLVELAMRSGHVQYVHADIICENDDFEYDLGEIKKHKINFKADRGQPYAAYAIAKMKDGTSACEVMSKAEIEAIRKRSRAAEIGPWISDPMEMWKKTCFRRLSKWLPLSPEYRDAVEADDAQAGIVATTIDVSTIPEAAPAKAIEAAPEAKEPEQLAEPVEGTPVDAELPDMDNLRNDLAVLLATRPLSAKAILKKHGIASLETADMKVLTEIAKELEAA